MGRFCVILLLESRTLDKVQKSSNSKTKTVKNKDHKETPGKHKRRCEDDIKTHLSETGFGNVRWT
jgi:hypothetical protein